MAITSRSSHLWYMFFWGILLSFSVIVYHSITASSLDFRPETWNLIDNIYKTLTGLIITAMVANVVSLIFREIKHSLALENMVVRKFLPTIRFTFLLIVWIIGGFFILESLQINTSGLLAGAGIWWAIFALASKDIIANLLWSLSIILSKTFEIGDTIRIKWVEGIVEEISLNYTKVMSSEGKVVYIPNRTINAEHLENLTRRRYFVYTYRVPFKKTIGDPKEVKNILSIIEGKFLEYAPIEIKITTDIPNANDFVYVFTVKVPEEDEEYDREIREFLVPYIFPEA